jgi:hypothetical protein
MSYALELKGVYVQRVRFTPQKLAAAYENLGVMMRSRVISYPHYPKLIAELNVFKSDLPLAGLPITACK